MSQMCVCVCSVCVGWMAGAPLQATCHAMCQVMMVLLEV